jgi:hypothetical protein
MECPQTGLILDEGYRIAIDRDEMKDPLTQIQEQQGCSPAMKDILFTISDLISIEVFSDTNI